MTDTLTLDSFLKHVGTNGVALTHWGVKGMKWGVRRTPEQLRRAGVIDNKDGTELKRAVQNTRTGNIRVTSKDYDVKVELASRLKEFGPSTLSNQEMQAYMNRVNLEQQYAKISAPSPTRVDKGKTFAKQTIKTVGKNEFNSLLKGKPGPIVGRVTSGGREGKHREKKK